MPRALISESTRGKNKSYTWVIFRFILHFFVDPGFTIKYNSKKTVDKISKELTVYYAS